MPLGTLLLVTGIFVPPALGGREANVGDAASRGQHPMLGVVAQIADQNDFVDAARGHIFLRLCQYPPPAPTVFGPSDTSFPTP